MSIVNAQSLNLSGTDSAKIPSGTLAQRNTPVAGSIRFNTTSNKFEGYNGTTWVNLDAAQGTNGNAIFHENEQAVTADYTLNNSKNAVSAGPIAINSGVTVTLAVNSTWTVV